MLNKKLKRLFYVFAAASVLMTSYPVNAQDISEEKTEMSDIESDQDASTTEEFITEETDAENSLLSENGFDDEASEQSENRSGAEDADLSENESENEETEPSIIYQGYVQTIGWDTEVEDGRTAGSTGRGLRMEGIKIKLDTSLQGGISYRTHVQSIGWQNWVSDGEYAGTQHRALRMEALQMKLTGEIASSYDIYYRVHVQKAGWLGWAKNGEAAGTESSSIRVEAVQIVLAKKGTSPVLESSSLKPYYKMSLTYRTHVQKIGWQNGVSEGAVSGSVGQALRLEAFTMSLDSCLGNGIQYRAHVQNIGWQNWQNNGGIAGTTGQGLRAEAIQIRLTGQLAAMYDIYYRVHVEDYGWLDWAVNGASAGTEGYSHRLEALQVKIVLKGSTAPGSTQDAFRSFGKLSNPCPQSYEVSDEFGPRESPGGIGSTNHKGRDYEAHKDDNILAAADGVVVKAEYNRYRGYYVIVSHWNGIKTVYQHMPRCEIAVGTMVRRGQVIGHVGTTGVSLSYHLHFEVWKNDVPLDPRLYL